ncbi:hypothetical protein COLO4_20572 [Corchorus olitorius]|uniref:Secreted protein n=1 Tax=Corchorus olitorius TaxID=93759 RepID=A0A1R3IZ05_9ROSI|nr:hypothetical protein COLO4_20572 [Corchorus olitorius]
MRSYKSFFFSPHFRCLLLLLTLAASATAIRNRPVASEQKTTVGSFQTFPKFFPCLPLPRSVVNFTENNLQDFKKPSPEPRIAAFRSQIPTVGLSQCSGCCER